MRRGACCSSQACSGARLPKQPQKFLPSEHLKNYDFHYFLKLKVLLIKYYENSVINSIEINKMNKVCVEFSHAPAFS